MIIKFVDNEPVIAEFCIQQDALNPYEYIINNAEIHNKKVKYLSLSSNEYQVYDINTKSLRSIDGSFLSEADYKKLKKDMKKVQRSQRENNAIVSSDCDMINYSSLDGWTVISDLYEGSVKENDTITYAYYLKYTCQSDITQISRTYGCSVVALCNLMRYYRMRGFDNLPSNLTTLYDNMWAYAGTNSDGGTPNGNEAIAAKNYLKDKGYACSTNSISRNSYSSFKKAIAADKPCILTYGALFNGTNGGHAVLAMGYVDTTSYQYLQVADGWNSNLRYINFNGYNYSRLNGWAITASK